MNDVLEFLKHHLTEAGFGGGALIVAIISTIPKIRPQSVDDWWDWFRSAFQTAIPAARSHAEPPKVPDKVADKPKE